MSGESMPIDVDAVEKLTNLVSQHGIYALFAIFLILWWILARQGRTGASTGHGKDVLFWMTIGLAALISVAWVYESFFDRPKIVVEGTVKSLIEQPVMPSKFGDPNKLVHRLAPFRSDLRFYTSQRLDPKHQKYDLDWALVSTSGLKTVLLTLQQEYCTINEEPLQSLTVDLSPQVTGPKSRAGTLEGVAKLQFPLREGLFQDRVHIVYKPDPTDRFHKLGQLYLVQDDEETTSMTPIPWFSEPDTIAAAAPSTSFSFASLFGGVAWASPFQTTGSNSDADSAGIERIKQDLSSQDLQRQIAAKDYLAANGTKSLAIIERILASTSGDHRQNLIIHNLSDASERLERAGTPASASLNLQLAEALYAVGNFELAARFFEKLPPTTQISSSTLLHRGLSFLEAERHEEAIRDFTTLAASEDKKVKSAALINLGVTYTRKKNDEEAQKYYEKALALSPKNISLLLNIGGLELRSGNYQGSLISFRKVLDLEPDHFVAQREIARVYQRQGRLDDAEKLLNQLVKRAPTDPYVLNNLAYVYALQGKNLGQALVYVNEALERGGSRPSYLDTKGWILHKMGESEQALPYLEKAFQQNPNDPEIRKHVEEARKLAPAMKAG